MDGNYAVKDGNDAAKESSRKNVRGVTGMIVSIVFLVAILTCAICDLAITREFSWSLYPISSIVFAWLVIMPAIIWERRGILLSLISCSVLVMPFLYVLEKLVGNTDLIMKIGLKSFGIGLPYFWIVFVVFTFVKEKFAATAISFLIAIPVFLIITWKINAFLNLPWIDVWDMMTLSIMILIIAVFYVLSKRHKRKI